MFAKEASTPESRTGFLAFNHWNPGPSHLPQKAAPSCSPARGLPGPALPLLLQPIPSPGPVSAPRATLSWRWGAGSSFHTQQLLGLWGFSQAAGAGSILPLSLQLSAWSGLAESSAAPRRCWRLTGYKESFCSTRIMKPGCRHPHPPLKSLRDCVLVPQVESK